MNLLLPLIPFLPLVAALALARRSLLRPAFLVGALGATLLALLVAMFDYGQSLQLSWLLLGASFGLEPVGRAVLGLAGLLWLAAGLGSLPLLDGTHGRRYAVAFLLTLAGNLGLVVSQDIAGFYCWFALMTFSAYGLVLHDGTDEARRAGRAYLVLAVGGELLLLAGLFTLAAQAGNVLVADLPGVYASLPHPEITAALIIAGFAVKMGVVPLHMWLPLAHPAAPVPASAVLSGVMLKAGLVGWLRLVPAEELVLPEPGLVLAGLGLAGAYLAALMGCFQERPKTVLAYSSVSQMGLLTLLVGLLVAGQGQTEALVAAATLFAVHHGLAKGTLFFAVPVLKAGHRTLAWLSLIPALALVGAPLTTGAVAKAVYKDAVPEALVIWISLSSVTTALIMLRFLVLAWPRGKSGEMPETPALIAWALALASSVSVPWWLAGRGWFSYTLKPASLLDALWPLAAAVLVGLLVARGLRRWPLVPEGDLLVPMECALASLRARVRAVLPTSDSEAETPVWPKEPKPLNEPRFGMAVMLMLGLVLLLTALVAVAARL